MRPAAMQDEEDARVVALQKFAAVRRFAQADAEPCRVLDGLYVGARLPWGQAVRLARSAVCAWQSPGQVCVSSAVALVSTWQTPGHLSGNWLP